MSKKVFISYSWDSEEHQDWVANLVVTLRKYGIQADFDASEVQHNLYQMMVEKIRTYDKILVVATKRYTEKANNFSGGVGTETKLLLDYFVNNESKIIVAKRDKCDVPFYLRGYEYIDLSVETKAAIESLARKINDMPKYKLPSVAPNAMSVESKQVNGFDFDNLIPDLRVATPQGKNEYMKEEFEAANKTILDLLRQTKQKNPGLVFNVEKREVNEPSGTGILEGNSFKQLINHYSVYTYSVNYQGKESYYRIWLSMNDTMTDGKGIFGTSERPLFTGRGQEFNSYQLWVHVSTSDEELKLVCGPLWGSDPVTNGKELGTYIFKKLIETIKR